MDIFSKLFKQKEIASITIKFYDEETASVEYKTDGENTDENQYNLFEFFAMYYAKMLYNLGRGEVADGLIAYTQTAAKSMGITNGNIRDLGFNILSPKQKLILPLNKEVIKEYRGELKERSGRKILQTDMSMGGEEYFAPNSVIMFLQFAVQELPEYLLPLLAHLVGGMNTYYRTEGDYTDIKSTLEAPAYGLSTMTSFMKQ